MDIQSSYLNISFLHYWYC